MATRVCSKCKKELDIFCFHKDKSTKDGFTYWCKLCKRQNYKNHIELILEQKKQYNKHRTKHRKYYNMQYDKRPVLFNSYFKQLEIFEEIRRCPESKELLEVMCAYCGKWVIPTNLQVQNRLQAFNGTTSGEQRFYCSGNCKQSCPTYGKHKYPKGFKKATSREVVPLLRQLVLKMDNYTCQMCGATTKTAQLHVHHEKSYTLNKIMANDPDNCWTLCEKCHLWVHRKDGCKYSDLRC